jgi:PAS domain S-box-containing protein
MSDEFEMFVAAPRRFPDSEFLQEQWRSLQQNIAQQVIEKLADESERQQVRIAFGNCDLLFEECLALLGGASEALRAASFSERIFSQILRTSSVGFLALNSDGVIQKVNDTTAHFWLETVERMCNRTLFDFVLPEDHGRLRRALRRCGIRRTTVEFRALRKNGDCFWCSMEAHSVPDTRKGNVILCSLADVTSARLVEDTVRKMSLGLSPCTGVAFLEQLVQYIAHFPDVTGSFIAVSVVDKPGLFRIISSSSGDFLGHEFSLDIAGARGASAPDGGVSVDEVYGQPDLPSAISTHPASRYHVAARVISSMGELQGVVYATAPRPLEKVKMYRSILEITSARVSAELSRMRDEEQLEKRRSALELEVGLRAAELQVKNANLEVEISQRARVELALRMAKDEAEQASRAKAAFLANMSHEIRTPLNGIVGFSSLLQGSASSPEQESYLQGIQECSSSLLRLIDDILDFSKMEADQLDLHMERFEIRPWLHSTLLMHALAAEKKGLWFYLDHVPDLPRFVFTDPARLKQIIDNLLSNALKFTSKGFVRVSLGMVRYPQNRLKISVADSGIGISQEQAQKIFDRFVQADPSTTRNYGGTGLGLSICRKLTEILGGQIHLESELGKGAAFSVEVPVSFDGVVACSTKPAVVLAAESVLIQTLEQILSPAHLRAVELNRDSASVLKELIAQTGLTPPEVLFVDDDALNFLTSSSDQVPQFHAWLSSICRIVVFTREPARIDADCLAEDLGLPQGAVQLSQRRILPQELLGLLHSADRFAATGSKVSSTQPLVPMDQTPPGRAGGAAHSLGSKDESLKVPQRWSILVVEDNEVNLKVLEHMLWDLGYQVHVARDGKEAVEAVEKACDGSGVTFDLVLMDCLMPVLDGYAAVAEMRRRWSALPPIVALTANALSYDRKKCLDAGFTDYVAKPVRKKDIAALVARYERAAAGLDADPIDPDKNLPSQGSHLLTEV